MTVSEQPALNTDRELWREREDDYYSNSIHVTAGGGIGMNVGGHVIVLSIEAWHKLAKEENEVRYFDEADKTQSVLGKVERAEPGRGAQRAAEVILSKFGEAHSHWVEHCAEIIDRESGHVVLLEALRRIDECVNDTTVAWELRLYQIKRYTEKAIREAE